MWAKIKDYWFCWQWRRQMKKDKKIGRWPI
jgi:hypothetical protein